MRLARHGFAGQCRGVEQAVALRDDAVERDALARANNDRRADLVFFGESFHHVVYSG